MIADIFLDLWQRNELLIVSGWAVCAITVFVWAMKACKDHTPEPASMLVPNPETQPMIGITLHTPTETFILRHDGKQKSVDAVEGALLDWIKDREIKFTLVDAGVIHCLVLNEHRNRQYFAANGHQFYKAACEAEPDDTPGDNWPEGVDLGAGDA